MQKEPHFRGHPSLTSTFSAVTAHLGGMAQRLIQTQLGNGSVVSMSYDSAGRLLYIGDPSSSSGVGFTYGLDLNGNRVTITENDGSQIVNVYDPKNRLTSESRAGTVPYAAQYAYDENDSLLARDLPAGGRVTFTLDNCGRVTADSAGSAYSWDTDGRLLSRTGVIGTLSYGYDYAGRVSFLNVNSTLVCSYLYDGDGRLQTENLIDGTRTID